MNLPEKIRLMEELLALKTLSKADIAKLLDIELDTFGRPILTCGQWVDDWILKRSLERDRIEFRDGNFYYID